MGQFVKGQYGEIILDTETDLSTATDLKIQVRKPNGTVVEETATLESDNTSLKASFLLDTDGIWQRRSVVTFTGGNVVEGIPESFNVLDDWKT
jgi:hypothetical protein